MNTSELPPRVVDPAPDNREVLLIGLDHRCAALELREKVAYSRREAEEALVELIARPEISEACLLSTCNRTEIYVRAESRDGAYRTVFDLTLGRRAPEIERQGRFYVHHDDAAQRHLLAVAAGLESMVLGEPEILGQVKEAAAMAEAIGASGALLSRLLRTAVTTGKRARAETAIGQGAVSLGYAVVELARNIFTRLEESTALLLGAGEIASTVARSLVEKGIGELRVANRSPERARRLARELPAVRLTDFERRLETLPEVDLVVASTSAEEPILTRRQLAEAMRRRSRSTLLVVDLGVPRNVQPDSRRIDNLFLHDLDSLEKLIDRNLRRRREEIPGVQEIIDQEMTLFQTWYRSLAAEPLVARLQKRAETIRRHEVEAVLSRFPPESHSELERLTRSIVRKLLHHPSSRLRNRAGGDPITHLDLVRELFRLDEETPGD